MGLDLEAVRARNNAFSTHANRAASADDVPALIAEVERLTESRAQAREQLKIKLKKAEREISVLTALFVDGCYEPDRACLCDGKCKYCARSGCEACCDGYAADHGSKSEEELPVFDDLVGDDVPYGEPIPVITPEGNAVIIAAVAWRAHYKFPPADHEWAGYVQALIDAVDALTAGGAA